MLWCNTRTTVTAAASSRKNTTWLPTTARRNTHSPRFHPTMPHKMPTGHRIP